MSCTRVVRSATIRAALLLLTTAPGSLAAQAVFTGRTINDSTREPIAGVEVVLEKPATRIQTDAEGRFSIPNIPWGVQHALIRKIGYRPVRLRLTVAGDDTLKVDLRMAAAAVELAPIEVTASTVPRGMEAFAQRRLGGFGQFFDSKDLRRAEHRRLSDFMTGVRGVRVVQRGLQAFLVSSRGNCPMSVWLNGVRLSATSRYPQDINDFSISSLDGIEVYAGASQTPAELMGTSGGSCGTVVLWTRRS